jgi:hypothetical protein
VVTSYLGVKGKIDEQPLKVKDHHLQLLTRNNCLCRFVATDADSTMHSFHSDVFARYQHSNGLLVDIVNDLSDHGRLDLTDFFDLLTNARPRLLTSKLALNGDDGTC